MAKQQTNSQQTRTDSYTLGSGWTVHKVGPLRIATKRVTWTSFTAGQSQSTSITLPDSKTFNDVTLTMGMNNNGGYVEYMTYGTQYTDTGTAANLWVRNYGAGTTGKITVTFTAIYEA